MLAPLKNDGNMLRIFERRILGMIYGSIDDNGIWKTGYSSELHMFYIELSTVKVIKIRRMRMLVHLFRMQELVRA